MILASATNLRFLAAQSLYTKISNGVFAARPILNGRAEVTKSLSLYLQRASDMPKTKLFNINYEVPRLRHKFRNNSCEANAMTRKMCNKKPET